MITNSLRKKHWAIFFNYFEQMSSLFGRNLTSFYITVSRFKLCVGDTYNIGGQVCHNTLACDRFTKLVRAIIGNHHTPCYPFMTNSIAQW